MKIKIDFITFIEPHLKSDFTNAEKFYLANSQRINGRLSTLTGRLNPSRIRESVVVSLICCGNMAHNVPVKALWFEIICVNNDEITYGLTGVDYFPGYYNPEPGSGGICRPV